MAQPIDPFVSYNPLTTDNFLDVKIESLKKRQNLPEFTSAINLLLEIRRILRVAEKAGTLQSIGGHTWYLTTLQWLKGEIALGDWIHVPQLMVPIESIDQNTVNSFLSHVQTMTASLKSDQNYLGIVNTEAIVKAFTSQRMRAVAEETVDTVAAEAQSLKENQEREFTDRVNAGVASVNDTINNGVTTIAQNVDLQLNEATQRFKAAQALDDWGDQYAQYVEELKQKLFGRIPDGLIGKNLSTLKRKVTANYIYKESKRFTWYSSGNRFKRFVAACIVKPFAHIIALIKLALRTLYKSPAILYVVTKNLYSFSGMIIIKLRSHAFQRAFWFGLLSFFVITFVVSSFVAIYGIDKIGHIDVSFLSKAINDKQSDTNGILTKLAIYLPVVILLGLAYSFAVKNYRIYANMLDQYEHRRVVARTSKGIILSLPQDSDDVRKTMTASAAQALFEHRNTGHLTKKEAESLNILDIFRSASK